MSPTQFATVAEAAQAQVAEAVIEMVKQGKFVDERDTDANTALHWSAWFKLDSLLRWLLEAGAAPDIGNRQGETPVHMAAKSANAFALDLLSRNDRTLMSQRDRDGFTPFILCAQGDHCQLMEWMYFKGISVEEQDNLGRTALHWASYRGHRKTVQWLLSRSASIVHRDHEGTTAVHWAVHKNRYQTADMLIDVGGVHLLNIPDCQGYTPMALATRHGNTYMMACFFKAQAFQMIFRRPNLSKSSYANIFVVFLFATFAVWGFIVAPGIYEHHWTLVVAWTCAFFLSFVLWIWNYVGDPGWLTPPSIFPQSTLIGPDARRTFDAMQPVESQMVHRAELIHDRDGEEDLEDLAWMENEQTKYNYQRQLISQANQRVEEDWSFPPPAQRHRVGREPTGLETRKVQLAQADQILSKRERDMASQIAKVRVDNFVAERGEEYLEFLEKCEFKRVCVVCRAQKTMRSIHCKDCGRCVDRHDHHCPWIDNCVGMGNQRPFFCFVVVLFATVVGYTYAVAIYLIEAVLPGIANGSFRSLVHSLWNGSVWPFLNPFFVLVNLALNILWTFFVGALVVRHSVYIMVNITTSEVLLRQGHVQRRFPKKRGNYWFLKGFNLGSAWQNCLNYWTANTEDDATVFHMDEAREEGLGSGVVDQGSEIAAEDVFSGLPGMGGEDMASGAWSSGMLTGSPNYVLLGNVGGQNALRCHLAPITSR